MGKEYAGELTLASKGFFYEDKFPGGVLHVEPWGTKEERLLISPNINYSSAIDRLISRLTDCPIPPGDLLLSDRQHIFFYMRCLSYGGAYSFSYKCSECGEKVKHDMDLENDLEVKYADDPALIKSLGFKDVSEMKEPFICQLPIQNKALGWRMLRGRDEALVRKYSSQMRKKGLTDEDPGYLYRLALRIMEVDCEPMHNISDALALVETLKGKDALAIREAIESVDIGIDPELEVVCRNCGYPNDVLMPQDKSFFRPGRSATQSS